MKKWDKNTLAKAIVDSGGVVNVIAKRVGLAWNTVRKAIEEDEELKELWQSEREKLLDMCEATVINAISSGDVQTAKWVLSTMGKHRGWGDSVNVSFDKNANKIIVEFVDKNTAVGDNNANT